MFFEKNKMSFIITKKRKEKDFSNCLLMSHTIDIVIK